MVDMRDLTENPGLYLVGRNGPTGSSPGFACMVSIRGAFHPCKQTTIRVPELECDPDSEGHSR